MDQELLDEKLYLNITANQSTILQQIQKTNLTISNTNQLSNRFLGQAFLHFKQGTEAIARIRANLDEIHKILDYLQINNNIYMKYSAPIIDGTDIEKQYSLATQSYNNAQFIKADLQFKELITKIERQYQKQQFTQLNHWLKKRASQCYLNRAVCLLSQSQNKQKGQLIQAYLQEAVNLDYLNVWAYFNLASYHYCYFNYVWSNNFIKCALSSLYLIKAVLAKDHDIRNTEKDLGKAVGLCSNNLQAQLLRLIIHIKQNRWKNALNQLSILQEIIGENQNILKLRDLIHPICLNKQSNNIEFIWTEALNYIKRIRFQNQPIKLQGNIEEVQEQNFAQLINKRMQEFNEIFQQVNELGYSHGQFYYEASIGVNKSYKKTAILKNILSKQTKQNPTVQIIQSPYLQAKLVEKSNCESKQSLFELSKSKNQCINESTNKQAEIQGNLLSSLKATFKPILVVEEASESQLSSFNIQSLLQANMRKKDFQIRAIESQIEPLDFHEGDEALKSSNHHYISSNLDQDEEDLLLDSAFQSEKNDPELKTLKQSSSQELSKSNRQQKRVRLYTSNQLYKFLEIFLVEFELKQSNPLLDVYCDIEIKGVQRGQKFTSKKMDTKKNGNKLSVQWNQSLGIAPLPQQPQNLQIKIMKCQKDKYYDTYLGSGQIQISSSGSNKLPVYNGGLIGMITVKLIPHEQYLNSSSFKQSSLSSSKKSEGSQP